MQHHTLDEMKTKNTKLAHRHLAQINRLIDDVYQATDPDYKSLKIGCYELVLAVVHVDGVFGSLPEEAKADLICQRFWGDVRYQLVELEMQNERAVVAAELDDYYASLPVESGW